jgi:hypothetical protein
MKRNLLVEALGSCDKNKVDRHRCRSEVPILFNIVGKEISNSILDTKDAVIGIGDSGPLANGTL